MSPQESLLFDLKHDEYTPIGQKSLRSCLGGLYLLRPIAAGQYSVKDLETLVEWRKREEKWAMAIFPVSLTGTQKWLDSKIISSPDIILFMIEDMQGNRIGHIGLDDCRSPRCEISYVMRGKATAPKGIMGAALRTLMDWAIIKLDMRTFTAQVFSDNTKSLNLFYRAGFHATDAVPLVRVVMLERIEWQVAQQNDDRTIERYTLWMKKEV